MSMPSSIRRTRGQAVVELTFTFLLFLVLFFAIVEFSHLVYTKVTLQHALREAGRYMVTGRTQADLNGDPIPRDDQVLEVFCHNLIATGLRCPQFGPQFSLSCLDGPCTEPGGGPEQTVVATATLNKRALTPLFAHVFSKDGVEFQLSTTWKNEPFSTN